MARTSPPPPALSEHVRSLVPYSPGKPIAEVRRELGLDDVVKLASNENALGPSPRALTAARDALADAHLYPEGSCYELRLSLSRHLGVTGAHLAFGNGSDELIHLLSLAFLTPGDEVLQVSPTFSRYEAAAALLQAKCRSVPLRAFMYDLEDVADRITDRTRLIFLANPNNPTGSYADANQVQRLLDHAPARCVTVFDEAYFEFVTASDFPDSIGCVRDASNVVVLRTFSKAYGLAGLRIGYAIARPGIIAGIEQVREPFNVSSVAQAAALAALTDDEHLVRSRAMVTDGRIVLTQALSQLGCIVTSSEANFVWTDLRRDAEPVYADLLRRGVIVRTGNAFGAPNHLRITVGTAAQNDRLISALEDALKQ